MEPEFDRTPEARPQAAEAIFGDRLPLAEAFVEHLATTGIDWGLIGPREVPRLWTRHVLGCALVSRLLEPGERIADLGSGAGLPGIPIALADPTAQVTLIEPLERRTTWLQMVVDDLGLSQVRVVRARAEELVDQEIFDSVTSRAVKALPTLARWTGPLLAVDGRMLAMKGASAAAEIESSAPALKKAGFGPASLETLEAAGLDEPTRVVAARRR